MDDKKNRQKTPRTAKQFHWQSESEKKIAFSLARKVVGVYDDALCFAWDIKKRFSAQEREDILSESITAVLRGENYAHTTTTLEYKRWRQAVRVAYKIIRKAEAEEAIREIREFDRELKIQDVIEADRRHQEILKEDSEGMTFYDQMDPKHKKEFEDNAFKIK